MVDSLVPVLPAGYRSRPATLDDVGMIHALVAECERALYGRVQGDVGGVAAVFARPGLVPETDTVLVHDRSGRLTAMAWVDRRSEVEVHPEHRGRGLGAALLDWVGARAEQAGSTGVVQTVPDGDAEAVALLRSRGYAPLVTAWLLEFPMAEEPAVPEPPSGITVRPLRPGDERATHALVQDAFDEWQERRQSYAEWAGTVVDRPTFAPALSPLAFHDGQLVGAALSLNLPERGEGYIEQLAVRRDQRGWGIARLLLRHAFRAFHHAGHRSCTLWTHSDTGALDLYLRVGMTVRHSSTVFRKGLRGADGTAERG
ncbi:MULTISPECIES: GNAT family N-acetyltransferase [unclassified Streptomyces]|uniref:GNAT family N-acetyltransferase n=1 Tax=unclassified Streptomyces TaxID=2593676 RepID=UPI00278C5655|nr:MULTISPECIES: GNAT family N-acetyltransferase [unclassified Streptomyces]